MKTFKTIIFLLFLGPILSAQQSPQSITYIPGEMIVQFEQAEDFQKFLSNTPAPLKYESKVSERFQLYLFTYPTTTRNTATLVSTLNQHALVKLAGRNFRAYQRNTTPNDERYVEQWNMDRIDAPEAWDVITGGTTFSGEEIVIAVIEGGDLEHKDLINNLWVNKEEIPDDGIDNDGNNYVDDYFGINLEDNTDTPISDFHSVAVAGIVGAQGNNEIGVTGVNWDVKMMFVSSLLSFPKIIESYEYIFELRKRYNESNGEKGAFIVATNASFGVDDNTPDQNPLYPIWCSLYDSLGTVGILSAAATTNNLFNIDAQGDMPSFCSSDYLIAVTDTDINDVLDGGYSATRIDLAAPGKGTFSTNINNSYGEFGGTSAATPHVSGAIGLLASYPCEEFEIAMIERPAETALLLKQIIMETVDPIEDLKDKTVSGGRLNLFSAVKRLQSTYGNPKGSLGIFNMYPNPVGRPGKLTVEYRTPEFDAYTIRIYDSIGQLIYVDQIPEKCEPRDINLDINSWDAGVYFITIENVNDFVASRFVVK